MKTCTACGQEKEEVKFNFRYKDKGIRLPYCAECGKLKTRKHYANNKAYYIKKARKHSNNGAAFLKEQKNVPCADCKVHYPYYVMDFDHLRDKSFSLSQQGKAKGVTRLKEEIEKCEVVCSNCHRERTHQRKMASPLE
jgi:hypothetical protein